MKSRRGFSLIEFVMTVAIVMLLGSAVSVFFSRFLLQTSADQVADSMTEELRKAKLYSMMNRANSSWGVRFLSNNITLFATSSAAFNENIPVATTINISGFSQVIFAKGTGIPDTSFLATVSAGTVVRNVSVNSQGGINR